MSLKTALLPKLDLKKNWNYKENKPLVIVNVILAVMALSAFLGNLFSPGKTSPEDLTIIARLRETALAPRNMMERIKGQIQRNMTLSDVLNTHNCPRELIGQLVDTAKPLYNLKKLIVGNKFEMELMPDRRLKQFLYEIDMEKYLQLDLTGNGYKATVKSISFSVKLTFLEGTIKSSLFQAINQINEGDQLAMDLADIFSCDIDFHTDLQPGDFFRLYVEKQYQDGQFKKYGKIRAAEFVNRGNQYTGFYFTDPAGHSDYYNGKGQSVRREFLKSPLKFARISSRFSRSRFHPILKIYRPHLGVDYAAPEGTPIVAAANGRVQFAGNKGGFGRFIQISHSNGMVSMYGHLCRFAGAIHSGSNVSQGAVIGYVGATGLATGPHLDYRVTRGGKFVNPLSIRSVPSTPINPSYMAEFQTQTARWKEALDAGPSSTNTLLAGLLPNRKK
jgi:murein DD-endopeptidase MepM/ murein hydrolase activator NlpD